jgi:signal transduction histidine kinase
MGKSKILVVDDSPLIHEMLGAHLESAGYEVVHANDGVDAINAAFTHMPDLIFLDINMPRINGYQVCRLLKDQPATHNIPIIIGTSRDSAAPVLDPKKWSFETGADGYVDKTSDMDPVALAREYIKPDGKLHVAARRAPMSEIEIMTALSHLLDKQLYRDVTRLQDLNQRMEFFVANVSHEIKSPMTVIKGNLENMKQGLCGQVTDQEAHALDVMLQTVERLNRMVNDLLDLAKIKAGKMTMKREEVCVNGLVDEMVQAFSVLIQAKKMHVHKELDSGLSCIMGDRDRLMQVFVNIFNNALKYTPDGGRIVLKTSQEGTGVRFSVQDNGPGMAPKDLAKIFDKYERITTEKKEGTGLGLAIAHEIVQLHGGKIWVESQVGKGTTFFVTL